MMNILSLAGLTWLVQDLTNLNIPIWAWVVLGIIVVAIVLGFVLGERTSVKRSPSMRETNTKEGAIIIPETGASHEDNLEIPQTGIQTESAGITNRAVRQAEGPVNNANLTLIEGIDSPVQRALYDAGITTFEQLSHMNVVDLKSILARTGVRHGDPATWPEQARLANAGRLEELRTWQQRLKDTDRL